MDNKLLPAPLLAALLLAAPPPGFALANVQQTLMFIIKVLYYLLSSEVNVNTLILLFNTLEKIHWQDADNARTSRRLFFPHLPRVLWIMEEEIKDLLCKSEFDDIDEDITKSVWWWMNKGYLPPSLERLMKISQNHFGGSMKPICLHIWR
jgi:hypothetical protein